MRARLLAATVAAGLALAGCSSGGDAPADVTPAARLTQARSTLDAAKSVTLDLTSRDVPPRQNGVTAAKGQGVVSTTEPKFKGTITGTIKGVAGTVEVIAVGAKTYLKFFTPDFVETDLRTLDAPNPATFFDPAAGISSLLPATGSPTDKGEVRQGRDVLHRIDGTLPGAKVTELFHLGEGTGTYTVQWGVTNAGELRTATLTGPFFPGATSTYTLVLTGYGDAVSISAP